MLIPVSYYDFLLGGCWYQCHIVIFYWAGVNTKFSTWHQKTYHYHDRSVNWNRHGECTKVNRGIWDRLTLPADSKHVLLEPQESSKISTIWKQFVSVIYMVLNDSFFYSMCKKYTPLHRSKLFRYMLHFLFRYIVYNVYGMYSSLLEEIDIFFATQLMQIWHWGPYRITIRNFLKIKMEKKEEIYLTTLLSKHFTY